MNKAKHSSACSKSSQRNATMDGPKDIKQLDMGLREIRSELPVFLLIGVRNHRVVVVGGDLWRLSPPLPLPFKQGH